jgi:iron complex transport system substrate-binding protein
MQSKVSKILITFLLAASLLAACTPATNPSQPPTESSPQSAAQPPAAEVQQAEPAGYTVIDSLGREVSFETPPQRIVIAGKAHIMIIDPLYAFPEASQRVVAFSKVGQGSGDFTRIIDTDYAAKTILDIDASTEQIAAAQPDVVLLKSYLADTVGKPLEELNIPVIYLDFETPEQYMKDIDTLGQLFQNPQRAEAIKTFYAEQSSRISQRTAERKDEDKPRVLLLYYSERDGEVAFNIPPLGWIQTLLVEMGGGIPVWKDVEIGKGWTKVGLEQIAAWDADQIYVTTYQGDIEQVIATIKADPKWQTLRAVQDGKLYAFPVDYYSWDQPDTRWALGLTWLAAKMNPQLFADLDMEQEVRNFYKTLYNLDDAAIDENIFARIKGDYP